MVLRDVNIEDDAEEFRERMNTFHHRVLLETHRSRERRRAGAAGSEGRQNHPQDSAFNNSTRGTGTASGRDETPTSFPRTHRSRNPYASTFARDHKHELKPPSIAVGAFLVFMALCIAILCILIVFVFFMLLLALHLIHPDLLTLVLLFLYGSFYLPWLFPEEYEY